jgi:hypothetical protein
MKFFTLKRINLVVKKVFFYKTNKPIIKNVNI